MKKTIVLLLQWNTVLVSFFVTPIILGTFILLFIERQAEFGYLRPLFEQPFHLHPSGVMLGGVAFAALLWPIIARYDLRTSHVSLALLVWACLILTTLHVEWRIAEHIRNTITFPVFAILVCVYLLRFLTLFPFLRDRIKFA